MSHSCGGQQSNLAPERPTTNGGVSMLRFRATNPAAGTGNDVLGTLDVNLSNNTFINNDYNVFGDKAVSVCQLRFCVSWMCIM